MLLVLKMAVPASAVSLTAERSLSYTPTSAAASTASFTGSAMLNLERAANIYVVDGINNTLEVFDTSIWLLPTLAEQNARKEIEQAIAPFGQAFGKVYFLDGINNTLQVLDTRSQSVFTPATSSMLTAQTSAPGKTYLVDEFNKSFRLSTADSGLVATSGNRNGLISPPFGETGVSENFYIVDGFNNSLEVSGSEISAVGKPALNDVSTERIANFFQGPLRAEDVPLSVILPLVEQFSAGIDGAEGEAIMGLVEAVSEGPFAEPVNTEAGIATLINSIGNPNRSLGWIKELAAANGSEGEEAFWLSREVETGPWKVSSRIRAGANDEGDIYLVDGFNSRLQTALTGENSLAEGSKAATPAVGNFSLVDGINNSLKVADTEAVPWSLLSGGGSDKALAEGGSKGDLSLDSVFSQVSLVADGDHDYFRVNGFNNKIELFDQTGNRTLINDTLNADGTSGIAQDGYGNIYVINGINNRIRALTNAPVAVPEPGSAIALLAAVGILLGMRDFRLRNL